MHNRLASWALACGLLLLAISSSAFAQFPAPLPTPDLDLTGPPFARSVVRLPDGKLVVAAPFFRVNGTARSFLVRLLPDGSVDTSWNPAPNGQVSAMYVDALGRLYVAGVFGTIAGQPRTRLARFDASGALDPAWTPTANNGANAFAPGLAGEICIGGAFTQVNGATRNRLACLSELDGALNQAWVPDANSAVSALLNLNGSLYIGGFFSQVNGTPRSNAARVSLSGAGALDAWNPAPTGNVSALLAAGATQLYVSGSFGSIAATPRPGVARLSATTGAIDAAWAPTGTSVSIMPCLAADGSGGIYVGGSFAGMGGQPRSNVARLSGTNGAAIAWNPSIDYGYATACTVEPNGDLVIAGQFAAAGNGEHLGIARLTASGSVDPQFNTALETNASAFVIARVPGDGSLIVGGGFARASGLIRRNLVRVTPAGAIDPNWNPAVDTEVRSLAVDAVGRVYVGGAFTRINGTARAGLARLLATPDGALDTGWNPPTFGFVGRILLRPEGLYVGGGAGPVSNLARLSTGATATVDSAWNPGLDGTVGDIVATLDGSLVIEGQFANVGGQPRAGIAKIGTGATVVTDPVWAPQVTLSQAGTLTLAEFDNFIYMSGEITAVNGVGRSRLAKVSAVGSGALDLAWAPQLTAAQGYAGRLAVDSTHVYVGGNSGGGFFRPFLQRYGKDDGIVDSTWRPQPDGGLFDVLVEPQRVCVAGFVLQTLGGQPRRGFGCLPKTGVDALFLDSFED
ncbi:MAG TPA: delta-60 repeat domain-containing protein [Xanthomonadales bacterium]|nr:delta-60 repeat domain-containing protein [Xanthomonadales bacterium]